MTRLLLLSAAALSGACADPCADALADRTPWTLRFDGEAAGDGAFTPLALAAEDAEVPTFALAGWIRTGVFTSPLHLAMSCEDAALVGTLDVADVTRAGLPPSDGVPAQPRGDWGSVLTPVTTPWLDGASSAAGGEGPWELGFAWTAGADVERQREIRDVIDRTLDGTWTLVREPAEADPPRPAPLPTP